MKHLGSVLRAKARERDRVYRIGGDEFGVLMMDCTEEEALGMMKRVCRELQQKSVRWVNQSGEVSEFFITVSIGVAQCDNETQIKMTFDNADVASYKSKERGKAQVVAYSTIKA